MLRSEIILQWVKGPDVLDVGCAGHVPEPDSPYWVHGGLRDRFQTVVGIDINEKKVRMLRDLGYEDIHLASAEEFQLDRRFDSIVAGELIKHLSNPGLFLQRCREHLKPHGRVILTTPYPFSLLYVLYAIFKFPKTCENTEHACWFCLKTLMELANRHGFKVVHWNLIEDYRLDSPSLRYRIFVRFISLMRRLIPKRLRNNTMIFVLELGVDDD